MRGPVSEKVCGINANIQKTYKSCPIKPLYTSVYLYILSISPSKMSSLVSCHLFLVDSHHLCLPQSWIKTNLFFLWCRFARKLIKVLFSHLLYCLIVSLAIFIWIVAEKTHLTTRSILVGLLELLTSLTFLLLEQLVKTDLCEHKGPHLI